MQTREGFAVFAHLELDVLEAPADRELLCSLAGRDPGPGFAPLLAAVGGHVLALELAGAFLATYRSETACSYGAALADESQAEPRPLVTRAFRTLWERLDEPVRQAWRIQRTAKIIDVPWSLRTGDDMRYPEASGRRQLGLELMNAYAARLHQAAAYDARVCRAFLRLASFEALPPSLFAPSIIWRVLRPAPAAQSGASG